MTTTPTSGAAIQRYKIGYHADEWGQRSSTPSGIPDASGPWVRYEDHIAALVAGQAKAAQPAPATQQAGERVYAFRRKGLADFCTCDEARYEELSNKPHLFETRVFYTAPQPSPAAQPEVPADQDDSILLCVSDLQHSAIYDNHVEMQACIWAVVDRIRGLVSLAQPPAADAVDAALSETIPVTRITLLRWRNLATANPQELALRIDAALTAQRVLKPLAAAPSPAAQGDALDAARLDWLTFNLSGKALRDIGVVWSEHGDARRAIDDARKEMS